jgi:tetratricopeptide (TPR) repeat protein
MEKQAARSNQPSHCQHPQQQDLPDEENKIHALIHQGMDAAEAGQFPLAETVFQLALTFAQTLTLPQWEAQARFGLGTLLDRAGKYTEAIPWFEAALALFEAGDSPRMEVNVGIFLANMLTKTGDPARSLSVLQRAKQRAEEGHTCGCLSLNAYEYELYGVYREFGCAYRALKQWDTALDWFQQGLQQPPFEAGPREISAFHKEALQLYIEQGNIEEALAFGDRTLDLFAPSLGFSQEVRATIAFQLGLLCMQTDRAASDALQYNHLALQEMQQWRRKNASVAFGAEPLAFLGRTCVNIGSCYGKIADSLVHYATLLAYWRCGEEFLHQAGAEDIQVPRKNIRAFEQHTGPQGFAVIQMSSEPLYQNLRRAFTRLEELPESPLSALQLDKERLGASRTCQPNAVFGGTA